MNLVNTHVIKNIIHSLIRVNNPNNQQDTFFAGDTSYIIDTGHSYPNYLISYDSNGNVVSTAYIGDFLSTDYTCDERGTHYITGNVIKKVNFGTYNVDPSDGRLLFISISADLKVNWFMQTGDTKGTHANKISYDFGYLRFLCSQTANASIGGTAYNLLPYGGSIVGEIDTSDGTIVWSKNLHANSKNSSIYMYGITGNDSRFFVSGSVDNSDFIINSDTLKRLHSFILATSLTGSPI